MDFLQNLGKIRLKISVNITCGKKSDNSFTKRPKEPLKMVLVTDLTKKLIVMGGYMDKFSCRYLEKKNPKNVVKNVPISDHG